MKRIAGAFLLLALAGSALAQGTITFNNRIVGVVDVKINNENGLPADGIGYSVQMYALQAPDQSTLATGTLLPVANAISTFRTGTAAGYFTSLGDIAISGIAGGAYATMQLRAWNNAGGSITSWENATIRGESNIYNSPEPLGNPSAIPATTATTLFGLQTFGMAVVPEPSTVVLGVMGGLALLLRRRK